jgi:hypothetical protein
VDSGVASIIAAIITAIASVAVALITMRTRIDRPSVPLKSSPTQIKNAPVVRSFRALGWSFVGFLYFLGALLTVIAISIAFRPYAFFTYRYQEVQAGLAPNLGYQSPIVMGTIFAFSILALGCFFVALFGTTRLLRAPPESN